MWDEEKLNLVSSITIYIKRCTFNVTIYEQGLFKNKPIFQCCIFKRTFENNGAFKIHFHINFMLECVLSNGSTELRSMKCGENSFKCTRNVYGDKYVYSFD